MRFWAVDLDADWSESEVAHYFDEHGEAVCTRRAQLVGSPVTGPTLGNDVAWCEACWELVRPPLAPRVSV